MLPTGTWFLFISSCFNDLIFCNWLHLTDSLVYLCLLLLSSARRSHFRIFRCVLHDLNLEVLIFDVCIDCGLNFCLFNNLVISCVYLLQINCATCTSSGLFILNLGLQLCGKVTSLFVCRVIRWESRLKIRASIHSRVSLWSFRIHVKSRVCFCWRIFGDWPVCCPVGNNIICIMTRGAMLLLLPRVHWLYLIHSDVVTYWILLRHYLLWIWYLAMLAYLRYSITSSHRNRIILCKNLHILRVWRKVLDHLYTSLWVIVLTSSSTKVERWCIFSVWKHVLYGLRRILGRGVFLSFDWGLTVTSHTSIPCALTIHTGVEITFRIVNFWWSLCYDWFASLVFESLRKLYKKKNNLH